MFITIKAVCFLDIQITKNKYNDRNADGIGDIEF